ncbi:MAG: hypothetical protein COA90_05580 [Gammaproteobacteria bacterium]|nr:MAG: hypothetical protein COA90_05580 [Gammaproteobacteria bacterium]
MKHKPKRISLVCTKNSVINTLAKRAQQLNKLNYILQNVMPPQFSAHCHLANISENTLVIHTDNASYASLLRFQSHVICNSLSPHLPQIVNKLEVKVRPKFILSNTPKPSPISLSNDAAKSLQQTADNIEDGPLKSALERLAKRRSTQ